MCYSSCIRHIENENTHNGNGVLLYRRIFSRLDVYGVLMKRRPQSTLERCDRISLARQSMATIHAQVSDRAIHEQQGPSAAASAWYADRCRPPSVQHLNSATAFKMVISAWKSG